MDIYKLKQLEKEAPFHKDMIGQTILVRKTEHDGAYYECKTGESILKQDVEEVKTFKVKVDRIAYASREIEVEARDEEDAKERALDEAGDYETDFVKEIN